MIQITFHYFFTLFLLDFYFQSVAFQKLAQNYIFQFSYCSLFSARARMVLRNISSF